MSHISAHVRLRPVRFAFLVQPDDERRALEIFQVNTCLWGGKYNPIIPCFNQVPSWWDRYNHHFETAIQIVNGFLDFFEPDFIVEADLGLADAFGFDKDRVLQLSSILTREGDRDRNGHGLSVFNLYGDLYRKEFQFARRHEHNIVDDASARAPAGGRNEVAVRRASLVDTGPIAVHAEQQQAVPDVQQGASAGGSAPPLTAGVVPMEPRAGTAPAARPDRRAKLRG